MTPMEAPLQLCLTNGVNNGGICTCHAAEPSGMIQITWIYKKGKETMNLVSDVAF